MPFPYIAILKQAYDFTRNNVQVWVFGIFVSLASGFHFLLLNVLLDRQQFVVFHLPISALRFWDFFQSPWLVSNLAALFLIIFVSAVCRGSLIWTAQTLAEHKPPAIKTALAACSRFAWPVFFLQIVLSGLFLAVAWILVMPVVYLVGIHEIGRAVALAVLGLAIFVPVTIFLGFMFLYSPIITVFYRISARSALSIAFELVQTKLKESLTMTAFLAGIWLGFLAAMGFGIILVSVPVAFLFLVISQTGLTWGIYLLIFSTGFLGLCALMVLSAGLAVFNNFAWTLTVVEMLKTEKHAERAKVLEPEAEPVS